MVSLRQNQLGREEQSSGEKRQLEKKCKLDSSSLSAPSITTTTTPTPPVVFPLLFLWLSVVWLMSNYSGVSLF